MRIVLTEIYDDRELETHVYNNQPVIRIGRDVSRNDVVFAREQWPTVSRVHAEIRFENRRWYVTDQGSRSGTLLNGTAISSPTEVYSGSLIQLGLTGPKLRIDLNDRVQPESLPDFSHTFIDKEAAAEQAALRGEAQQRGLSSIVPGSHNPLVTKVDQSAPQLSPLLAGHSNQSNPVLICESGSNAQLGQRFVIKGDRTVLGRDPSANIQIVASAPVVSRHHAEIQRRPDGTFVVIDLNSFNGTLVNGQRIVQPTELHDGDRIQFAAAGPIFCFAKSEVQPPKEISPYITRPMIAVEAPGATTPVSEDIHASFDTISSRLNAERPASYISEHVQFLFQRTFDGKTNLSVGRDSQSDIPLDGLMISKHHARFFKTPEGVFLEDTGSTNGVFVNGERIRAKRLVQNTDLIQIGGFVLGADAVTGIAVFDTRAKTRIDAVAITETRGNRKLLDDVSLAIEPNEFVGVLGPSGAGKSLLLTALNGMRQATSGRIYINNLDIDQHLDSVKQWLGYVPQDDIIHRQLTVYRTLFYVARLRLSRDIHTTEIENIISEVLDVTGLSDRRDVLVSELSGGQRKRVSIAVELITKPSVIFLDEPTSGLDPATEARIMKLFRQITESGRTVILTTHAMENVRLFDRIILMMRGKLIFYGTPAEALEFVGVKNFIDLFNKLEAPIDVEIDNLAPLSGKSSKTQQRAYERHCEEIADKVAEDWRQRFMSTDLYGRYIARPLSLVNQELQPTLTQRRRRGVVDAIVQWVTLVRRYTAVILRDKSNVLILLGQAPIIGLLTYLVVGKNDPRDFPYFILALVAIWFGTSVAARELVKERPIFERERMVNLGLLPYVGSKLLVLTFIIALQTTLLFVTVKLFDLFGAMSLPGVLFGFPQLLVMTLTGMVGIGLGLFISAVVRTSEVATSLVPLILIPQILFAGLTTVPTGVSKVIGASMPATWSFDELKRLSALDTLNEEGSDVNGPNKGKGLYLHIKETNKKNFAEANNQLNDYNRRVAESLQTEDRQKQPPRNRPSASPSASPSTQMSPVAAVSPPTLPAPQEINQDLSKYVSFKHPWGGLLVNPAILLVMFLALFVATIIALRLRDIR